MHQTRAELAVASTVIRPQSVLSATFVLTSAYTGDFYSFCLTREGAFGMCFRDEFTSHTAQLERPLNKEKNKEGLAC